jgi:transcription initiation factor TFIIIB Brf1 subunit/transcription initiation factor TFIIB
MKYNLVDQGENSLMKFSRGRGIASVAVASIILSWKRRRVSLKFERIINTIEMRAFYVNAQYAKCIIDKLNSKF